MRGTTRDGRFGGTIRHITANWPLILLLYGFVVVALIIIGLSVERGWLSFIPMALALLLTAVYALAGQLWVAHNLFDDSGLRPEHVLFDMGDIQADSRLVYLDLGLRWRAISLGRRLTTGRIVVVDIYNPQATAGPGIARLRARMAHPPSDPRLVWQNGNFNMLPFPDNSVSVLMACQVLSEFQQHGDRQALLEEIHRVMRPNGTVVVAEQVYSRANLLVRGPFALRLPSTQYWRNLLQGAGFLVRRERDLNGLIYCFRANKPTPTEAHQLSFELDIV